MTGECGLYINIPEDMRIVAIWSKVWGMLADQHPYLLGQAPFKNPRIKQGTRMNFSEI